MCIYNSLKYLAERKKLRYTLQMKDLIFFSLVRTWDTFSEVMLAMNLDWCSNEKELTNQNMLPALSAYTPSYYTDLMSTILLATHVSLHRCFPFISTLKAGDIITTGLDLNYQTFSNLQFWPLLKNFFDSKHIHLRDTSGEETPSVSAGINRLVSMFREASNIRF